MKFTRMLPALLKRTNVVLELRDSRLPLTSINRTLEGVLLLIPASPLGRVRSLVKTGRRGPVDAHLEVITHISGLGALKKWRLERGWDPNNPTRRIVAVDACEHIVVLNKRDLVPEWGMEVNPNNH